MPSPAPDRPRLAFVGGTGPEGRGLALRFGQVGFPIAIGSRSEGRAQETAEGMRAVLPEIDVVAGENPEVIADAAIIFLTIPYAGIGATLPPLADAARGKIVVSAIAPIEFQEGRPVVVRMGPGSAAEEVRDFLPESRIVSGFQTVDAYLLQDLSADVETDVVISSDDVEARREIVRLAGELVGVRALSGGRLAASRYVEECTALLITLNRIYKAHSGVRFTGINRPS